MKICLDCRCDISERGSRAIRCTKCQRKYRLSVFDEDNKRKGTSRKDKTTYQWGKEVMKMNKDEVVYLISQYKNKIKNCKDEKELIILKTRVKIMTDKYKELSDTPGSPRSTCNKCETCRFYNRAIDECTLGSYIERDFLDDDVNTCKDYEYDNELVYKNLNDIAKDAQDDEGTYPNDELFIQPVTENTIRKRAMLPHSEEINWQKAEHGWTKYYDEGIITLDPDVFFSKKKVNK